MRYGRIVHVLCLLFVIGLISCDERQPFQPTDPVDKILHGRVTDDMGNPLPQVSVTIYEQNRIIGADNYAVSLVTDKEGEWLDTLSITSGQTVTIVYSRSGLIDLMQSKFVSMGIPDTVDLGTVSLPPADFEDEYRIVLTWESIPPDLDAHLTGPKGDGSRFHVYWNNKTAKSVDGDTLAKLISDRQHGFGPETATINKLMAGTYRFSVHNYSRNEAENDTSLVTMSNAIVRVFGAEGLHKEFSISGDDAPADSVGNAWHVFEINGETREFTLLNKMSDGVGFDDQSVFRIEEKPGRVSIP